MSASPQPAPLQLKKGFALLCFALLCFALLCFALRYSEVVQQLKAQIEELHALLKARPLTTYNMHALLPVPLQSSADPSLARLPTSLCARKANSSASVWYTCATQSCMSACVGLLQPYRPRRPAMYAQICSVGQSFSADVARCAASARTKPVIPFSARRSYQWLVVQAGAPAHGTACARFCGDRRERRGASTADSPVCIHSPA